VGAIAAPAEASVHQQRHQDHGTAAEGIGQRPVEQHHEGEGEQEHAQGLLHRHRPDPERAADRGDRRQVGIDRQRAHHAEAGQQHR
jgi:hypothetical protein